MFISDGKTDIAATDKRTRANSQGIHRRVGPNPDLVKMNLNVIGNLKSVFFSEYPVYESSKIQCFNYIKFWRMYQKILNRSIK